MRRLLILAKVDAERKRSFGAIATATAHDLTISEKVETALGWLETHEPRVVIFDTAVVGAEKVCHKLRSQKRFAQVPLIALVGDESDPMLERLYTLGADDVISASSGAQLIARLRALPEREQLGQGTRGLAVVADKDTARCDALGRVLLNAGYDVKFALDDVALRYYTQQDRARLVVASAEMGPARALIEEARQRGSGAAWIVTARRRDLLGLAETLDGMDRVTVLASSTSPENVLFTSNELLHTGKKPVRAGERALYGTVVLFRAVGGENDELGFSYNVSGGGVFVRTLAAPAEPRVWLELRPPRSRARVRLEGRIAWRRPYDPGSAAAAPPGFGAAIEHGLGEGLEQFRQQVEAFVRSTRTGPEAVARLVAETLETASPNEIPGAVDSSSDSRIQVVSLAVRGVGTPPAAPAPSSSRPRSVPPPLPPDAAVQRPVSARPPPLPLAEPLPASIPPGPRRSLAPILLATFALVALLGAGGFFLFWPKMSVRPAPVAPPPVAARSSAPPAASASVALAEADAAAVPAPDGGAADSSAEAAGGALPPVDPGDAGADDALKPATGVLVIRSRVEADVYLSGLKIGPTNRRNVWQCGMKWLKLGQGDAPHWLTPGQTIDVKCKTTTTIELEPD
jgi:CheY-like chemotaxis protein